MYKPVRKRFTHICTCYPRDYSVRAYFQSETEETLMEERKLFPYSRGKIADMIMGKDHKSAIETIAERMKTPKDKFEELLLS